MIDLSLNVPEVTLPFFLRHRNCFKRGGTVEQSVTADYLQIKDYLPEKVETILDIGCGMAAIGVYLLRHYPGAKLLLLDGDGSDTRDGWQPSRPEPFSSRAAANELLAANGIAAERWIDVNTKEHLRADLVISLASWGYHYPISTYNVTGFCVADLRKSEEKARGMVIETFAKFNRCAWRMKGTP